jgi:lipoyl(octanoyl) transferase
MQHYTNTRSAASPDQLWLLEHPPVFTLGQAGKPEHLLDPGDIPVVQSDRGGQITYHGPGQLIAYVLLDLHRIRLGIRALVNQLEEAVISLLQDDGLSAATQKGAPGVYIGKCKIASLGLRVRRGCSYHGLSLNVDMDMTPFTQINPCGYPGLPVTQLRDFGLKKDLPSLGEEMARHIAIQLGYTLNISHQEKYYE